MELKAVLKLVILLSPLCTNFTTASVTGNSSEVHAGNYFLLLFFYQWDFYIKNTQ